ncbi:MAG: multiheme c-type cytochrome [Ghiorsea sp.]
MYKYVKMMLLCLAGALLVAATQLDFAAYWQSPTAVVKSNHDWSALEKNMRPEACAQCHESQFNDWKNSLHAEAFSPGLIGQFPHMGSKQEVNDCLRCHAPLDEQLYVSEQDMMQSLKTLRKHPQGFDADADLDAPQASLPLRHAGVSCAVCHVRDGQRFGPPRLGSKQEGMMKGDAHGGFVANNIFESSHFCAECHQFPQSYAINGKPLENTVTEWQQSRFASQGKQCQTCHMPDRKHQFKGIHDKAFTRQGLKLGVRTQGGIATLSMTSKNIGHAFPTYVTPKVIVKATALDKQGEVVKKWQWDIVREVFYGDGWQEKRDTRLMPGETRLFVAKGMPNSAVSVQFSVVVIPDQFYKGVYESLLQDELQGDAKRLIKRALHTAKGRNYVLFSQRVVVE